MPWVNAIARSFTEYSPTRGVAAILGMGLVAWGGWVFAPGVSFTSDVYKFMLTLAVEPVWGALFLFAGLTMMVGVYTKDIEWIRRGSFLGFVLWGLVAILGVIAEPSGPVVVTRMLVAVLHAWIYIQVKVHPGLIQGTVSIQDLKDYKLLKENKTND